MTLASMLNTSFNAITHIVSSSSCKGRFLAIIRIPMSEDLLLLTSRHGDNVQHKRRQSSVGYNEDADFYGH